MNIKFREQAKVVSEWSNQYRERLREQEITGVFRDLDHAAAERLKMNIPEHITPLQYWYREQNYNKIKAELNP